MQLLSRSSVANPRSAVVLDDRSGRVAALSSAGQVCAKLLACDSVIAARHARTVIHSSMRSSRRYAIGRLQVVNAPVTYIL